MVFLQSSACPFVSGVSCRWSSTKNRIGSFDFYSQSCQWCSLWDPVELFHSYEFIFLDQRRRKRVCFHEMLSEVYVKLAVRVFNSLRVKAPRLWACAGTAATCECWFTDTILQEGKWALSFPLYYNFSGQKMALSLPRMNDHLKIALKLQCLLAKGAYRFLPLFTLWMHLNQICWVWLLQVLLLLTSLEPVGLRTGEMDFALTPPVCWQLLLQLVSSTAMDSVPAPTTGNMPASHVTICALISS